MSVSDSVDFFPFERVAVLGIIKLRDGVTVRIDSSDDAVSAEADGREGR